MISAACRRIGVLFAAAMWFGGSLSAADWNQWRGPNRDGAVSESPPLMDALPESGLKPAWISAEKIPSGNGGGWSSPIVAAGKVFLFTHTKKQLKELGEKKFPWLPPEKRGGMSDADYAEYERQRRDEDEARSKAFVFEEVLYCLDDSSGATLWKNSRTSVYTRFPQSGCPAVVDGRAYVLGAGLVARCIDVAEGKTLWETSLPGEFRDEYMQSSFAVADGVAIVLAGRLHALDAKSGEILWSGDEKLTSGTDSSPVFWRDAKGAIAIANVAGSDTAAFDPRTGNELWRIETEGERSTPVLVGDRMLTFGSSRKKGLRCFAISRTGAELAWKYHGVADPGGCPVVVGGHVFVQGEGKFACVALETGEEAWLTTLDVGNPRYASLAAADGKVFYAFDNVFCFAADPAACRTLMNAKIDQAGLLVDQAAIRKLLKLDELEKTAEGQKEAAKLLRENYGKNGVVNCTSPAIAGGRLYLRLDNGVACYNLSATAGK